MYFGDSARLSVRKHKGNTEENRKYSHVSVTLYEINTGERERERM
jgi:hypothetical protein